MEGRRDEGYRPLVLFQRQRIKEANSATRVFRASFSEKCSWGSGKEILKSNSDFLSEI